MPIASDESEVDIEVAEVDPSSEDDFDGKDEEEAGEDELEESDNDRQSTEISRAGPLKIKLKLGARAGATSETATRRFIRQKNSDVESEDSDSDQSEVNSSAAGPSSGRARQLTARQAVLASAVDPSHVTLDSAKDGAPSKKTKFTPSEVALRKEENARKRKNMIEKKLEDEKAETIHRLLKKQSRPKNKRTAAAPQSDEDVDMDDEDTASAPGGPTTPMYRWVSTARKAADLPASDIPMPAVKSDSNSPPAMTISFSIPTSFLPGDTTDEKVTIQMPAIVESKCTVDGCGAERKYRAVGKSWGIGACGLDHLKILEGRA